MTPPNPTPPDPKPLLTSLIEAFTKLPPLLSFGGLISVIGVLVLSITGVLPELFLLYPLIAIVAFIILTLYTRRLDIEERKVEQQLEAERLRQEFELKKSRQQQKHAEKMAGLQRDQEKPLTPPAQTGQKEPEHEVSPEEWQNQYMAYLMQLCGYPPYTALIDIREAGIKVAKIALEKIFTSLDVPTTEQLRHLPKEAMLDRESPDLTQMEREQREPVLKAIGRSENKHLVILGAPGSGKSTLINFLTLCLAGDHLQDKDINQSLLQKQGWELAHLRLIPVLVILRKYAADGLAHGQDLWSYIAAVLTQEGYGGYLPHLEKQLQKGGMVLLDGLDEVDNAPQVRQALKMQIEKFATRFREVRLVVTSRPYAYGAGGWELNRFAVTRLLDFSPEQIETFIDQWYTVTGQEDRSLGEENARKYAEELKRQVNPDYQSSHNLRELARSPLLLTMMVYVHRGREGGQLPQRREELYQLCIKLLLELWQRSKNINLLDELQIAGDQLEKALQEVAFAAHKDQPALDKTAEISGELLAGKLHKYRGPQAKVDPAALIEYVRDRAGLIQQHHTKANDDDDDLYSFPHRTFQEYLAGLYLLRTDFPRQLAALSKEDPNRWREALLLAAATAARTVPSSVWSLIDKLCPKPPPHSTDSALLLSAVHSATPAPTGKLLTAEGEREMVRASRGAFLAGQVLAETRTELLNPEIPLDEDEQVKKQRVQQWQKTIVAVGLLHPRDRAQAGDLLAELGDDRPGVLSCDEMPFCYVPPGEFWLGDDQKSTQGHWNNSLDKPYWLAQYPVTVAQFRQFVQEQKDYRPGYGDRPLQAPDNRPVLFVNWYDALAFCDWLSRRWQKLLPPGYRVTLPSEAEWEKAARGGRLIPAALYPQTVQTLRATLAAPPATRANPEPQRPYPWGSQPEPEKVGPEQVIYRGNSEAAGIGQTTAVGSFPTGASPVGGMDMAGNVWEWTRSYWGKNYPYHSSADYETIDPKNREEMVLRGGSFYSRVENMFCSARGRSAPHHDLLDSVGFRVVVASPPTSGL
ncbi:MAG: SUMF1/EgtB/PvdO family nonheme iron enzyme [Anaerolineae bacterium]|nr:SUMF1/EgtB/PvdO family nonheme iron enzyme [Anaerolineae bacterium]